jgi:hypothetical protein
MITTYPTIHTATGKEIDASVQIEFNRWMLANRWTSGLTRAEAGRLGAAKRELNRVLRRRGLTFEEVAQALV